MIIESAIQLQCGGPGSGRRPGTSSSQFIYRKMGGANVGQNLHNKLIKEGFTEHYLGSGTGKEGRHEYRGSKGPASQEVHDAITRNGYTSHYKQK